MGVSTDYPNVPEWVSKSTGYQAGSMVKYKGNIFYAAFWGLEPGVGDADHNGWRFYDELYDLTPHTPTQEAKIIAYIPTWRKKEGFNYANAEMYRHITHGIVAFLMFSETNLGEFDPTSVNDVNAVLPDVVNTGHEKDTRISIALGGATDYGFFNLMTSVGNNPANPLLDKAVQNVVNFVKSNDLDGVDLDLECWWDKNSDPSKDQGGRLKSEGPHPAGYALTLFAQKLKQAMPDKLVSVTLFGTSWYGNNYDSKIADYVDWLAIMTYDLTGSWNASPVGPHSALFKIRNQDSAKIREQEFYQESYTKEQQGEWPGGGILNNPILSVEDTLWYWTNPLFVNSQGAGQNIPRNKIATGVPTYGYDFAYQKDPDDLSGQIPPGYKLIQYKNILAQFPDASTAANGNIKVPGNTPRPPFVSAAGTYPYAHDIYFETPQTATDKLNFLKSIGAQGVIIWELSNDVWEEGKSSILKVLYKNSGNPDKSPAIQDGGSSVGDGDFGKPVRYDTGDWSDVALNSENVVVGLRNSIVNDNPGFANLSYDIGRVDGDKIQWTSNFPSLEKGERWPSIAINNSGLVVEVYESSGGHTLWCKVGNVVADNNINGGKRIDWGESWQYDGEGTWPSVAINDHGLVVGVHTTDRDNLWYRVGTHNSSSSPAIDWRDSIWYGSSGEHPSVAINNNGLVVEVHQSSALGVSYRVGRVADDGIHINWGDEIKYDNGIKPSVAINNDGLVVEVHQSESGDTLWYRGTGQVNDTNKTITWSNAESQDYSNGQSPRVACNGEFAVETNCGIPIDGKTNEVFYSVLTLPAYRSNWIQLQGENSYFYCACNRPANNKERQASDHTMTIQEGAPYLYAVLTKDDDTADFPDGAVLTIEGPDGTQYDRDIEEENQLVIMSDSSVRCLIIKDPKPGDWKMTMTVPEGVGFHCECNTVPSKDPYKTITTALSKTNQLQKRDLSNNGKTNDQGWLALYAVWLVANLIKDVKEDAKVGAITGGVVGAGVGFVGGPTGPVTVPGGALIGALTGALGGVATGLAQGVTAMSTQMAALAQANAAPPEEVRIATWNVFHGNLAPGNDPAYGQPRLRLLEDRVAQLLNFGVQNNIGLITFQEMPRPILNAPNHALFTTIRNLNYDYVIVNDEYPSGGTAPVSTRRDGYLIVYNPAVFTLQNIAPGIQWQYFQPQLFLQGIAQARPPVQLQFQNLANGTVFDFLTWHTEPQRGNAQTYVTTAFNQLSQQQGNWILAGDLNMDDNHLPPGLVDSHHLTGDNLTLDHIITSGTAINPEADTHLPGRFTISQQQWGWFWSDAHYVLFGIVQFP